MEPRQIAALLLGLATLAAIVAVLLYATREVRGERREQKRGERLRIRRNAARVEAEADADATGSGG